MSDTEKKRKPVPACCPRGGPAPCPDDLCRGVDRTLCGLERGWDFCDHGYAPETCPECSGEGDDDDGRYDDVSAPSMAERLRNGDAQPDRGYAG